MGTQGQIQRLTLVALLVVTALLQIPISAQADQPPHPWRALEPGLDWGLFRSPVKSHQGDSRIRVLRIDPRFFTLQLHCASAPGQGRNLSVRDWSRRENLVAGINAGMYAKDHRTSISFMKTSNHVNNRRLTKHRSILLFDCLTDSLPPARIVDLTCADLQELSPSYGSQIQSIRMLSCDGRNTWEQQSKRWSASLVGEDRQGRILFIFVRSPYTMHDLVDILLELPLDLTRLQYGEGGPQAQLYIDTGNFSFYDCGRFEKGFLESDAGSAAWPIPNVLGIVRKVSAQTSEPERSR